MPGKRARKAPAQDKEEQELQTLSNEELRKELILIGKNPGPIDSSNRDMYIRQLIRTKKAKTEESLNNTGSSVVAAAGTPQRSTGVASLMRSPIKSSAKRSGMTKLSISPALAIQSPARSFNMKGLVAAPFTPFTDDGDLNLPVIGKYADFLCQQGVYNVFVCGTTGEGMSMSLEERQLVAEEWIKVSKMKKRMQVVVHVGTENLKNSCELAMHAVEAGADAIAAMPPSYFKPPSLEALVMYLEKLAEAAPTLPLFYYHIPAMTGVKFNMVELLDMAASRLPTLRGIKFTYEDLMEYSRCLAHSGGKYLMMYGRDEQVLGSYCMGGTAAVGSTYNYCGKLNTRMLAAYERGDMKTAQLEQRRSQESIQLLKKYGGSAGAGKAFMRMRGMDIGPPRLPLFPLSAEDYKALQADLKTIGFFEWA